MERNVNIVSDLNDCKMVVINDIIFKGRQKLSGLKWKNI